MSILDEWFVRTDSVERGKQVLGPRAHHVSVLGNTVIVSQGRGRTRAIRGQDAVAAIAALDAGYLPRSQSRNSAIIIRSIP